MDPSAAQLGSKTVIRRRKWFQGLAKQKMLYFMAIPGIVYYILFKYVPMAGIIIAFQDYNVFRGITNSEFVGLQHFQTLFSSAQFLQIFKNTLIINFYDLLFGFTSPIILALILNEVMQPLFKKLVQSLVYLPHFLSWVVVGGLIGSQILSPSTGMLNHLIEFFGGEPIYFLIDNRYIRSVLIGSGVYKEIGWGTIIYLAALAGVNPNLYEAASIDGAGKLKQLFVITLPSILSVISIMFLLKIGHFLDFGFDRVWVFLNGANMERIDIFDTYVYRVGLTEGLYSYSTAVGLFKSVVGLILLMGFNSLSKRLTGESLY